MRKIKPKLKPLLDYANRLEKPRTYFAIYAFIFSLFLFVLQQAYLMMAAVSSYPKTVNLFILFILSIFYLVAAKYFLPKASVKQESHKSFILSEGPDSIKISSKDPIIFIKENVFLHVKTIYKKFFDEEYYLAKSIGKPIKFKPWFWVLGQLLLTFSANFVLAILGLVKPQTNQDILQSLTNTSPFMMAFIIIILAPFLEEIIFRGLLPISFRKIIKGKNAGLIAYIIPSLLFMLIHTPNGISGVVSYGLMSFYYLAIRLHYKSLASSILAHSGWNALVFLISMI